MDNKTYLTLCGRDYECENRQDIRFINAEICAEEPPRWLAAPDFILELIGAGKWPEVLELAAIGQSIIQKDKKLYKKLRKNNKKLK